MTECKHYRDRGEAHREQHACVCPSIPGKRCQPAYDGTVASCPSFTTAAKTVVRPSATVSLPCVHLGQPTGEQVQCKSCSGNVQLKVFACATLGKCTVAKPSPAVTGCCAGCSRTAPSPVPQPTVTRVAMPTDPTRRDGHGAHYNCSVVRWQGKLLMASRFGWDCSTVHLCELGDGLQVVPGTLRELMIRHTSALAGQEDPRLFVHRNQLHVATSGYDQRTNGGTSVFISSLDDQLRVEKTWAPQYARRRSWEKNWATWSSGDKLYSVYEVDQQGEHVVVEHRGEQAIEVARTKHDYRWAGTVMRGGASPVRVGGEMYHWFHSVQRDRRGLVEYGVGLYTFAAAPPFQILRRVPGVVYLTPERVKMWNKSVTFPCGAVLDGGRWSVSVGHQDRECRILTWDAAAIEGVLK